jgi:hypothetical protein
VYKDELWHRQLIHAIDACQADLSAKQLRAYQVDLMLRIASRVKELSDTCEACCSFQQTLTHLLEELPELPQSKAQRYHHARQLHFMTEHFVKAHRLAPAHYYIRLGASYGFVLGLLGGIAMGLLILNNGLYLLLGAILGGLLGVVYGMIADASVKRSRRLL